MYFLLVFEVICHACFALTSPTPFIVSSMLLLGQFLVLIRSAVHWISFTFTVRTTQFIHIQSCVFCNSSNLCYRSPTKKIKPKVLPIKQIKPNQLMELATRQLLTRFFQCLKITLRRNWRIKGSSRSNKRARWIKKFNWNPNVTRTSLSWTQNWMPSSKA